jgi:hypothetical protein
VVGRHVACLCPREDIEDDRPEQRLRYASCHGRGEFQAWHLRKDCKRIAVLLVITALRNKHGELTGFHHAIALAEPELPSRSMEAGAHDAPR